MNNKQAVLLNYGRMVNDIGNDIKEHTNFIHHFFDSEPNLNHDKELIDIAMEFQEFCIALKRLDKMIESVSKKHLGA